MQQLLKKNKREWIDDIEIQYTENDCQSYKWSKEKTERCSIQQSPGEWKDIQGYNKKVALYQFLSVKEQVLLILYLCG